MLTGQSITGNDWKEDGNIFLFFFFKEKGKVYHVAFFGPAGKVYLYPHFVRIKKILESFKIVLDIYFVPCYTIDSKSNRRTNTMITILDSSPDNRFQLCKDDYGTTVYFTSKRQANGRFCQLGQNYISLKNAEKNFQKVLDKHN